MATHSFTCIQAIHTCLRGVCVMRSINFLLFYCLYSPAAAEYHRPLAGTHFTVPRRVEDWVDIGGWLHTEIKCRPLESNRDTVTHPSTNWAQHRVTPFMQRMTHTYQLEKSTHCPRLRERRESKSCQLPTDLRYLCMLQSDGARTTQ